MNSDPNRDLLTFVERFFTCQGAAVEKRGAHLDVLAPRQLAQRIGIPEFCSLAIGSDDTGGHRVHYGSSLLESISHIAGEQIPLAVARLRFNYLKSQGFDRMVAKWFSFPGAIVQVDSTAAVQTAYLVLNCRFLAQSDEQKEGLLPLAFNLETGAPVGDLHAMLDAVDKEFEAEGSCNAFESAQVDAIAQWVHRQADRRVATHIASFRDSMNRRLRRDVANLEAYYDELKVEMTDKLSRAGLSEQLVRERKQKIALIPDEMAKKKDDLFKKYSIRVTLTLSSALLIRTPAVKLSCRAIVGRRKKMFGLLYNPIDKSLDPVVCDGCGDGTTTVNFCHALHLLCTRCVPRCPRCQPGHKQD